MLFKTTSHAEDCYDLKPARSYMRNTFNRGVNVANVRALLVTLIDIAVNQITRTCGHTTNGVTQW